MNRFCLALMLALAGTGCLRATDAPQGRATATAPVTILVGQSWLGLWQGDRLIRQLDQAGWQFNAVRLAPDGTTIEIAAYRVDGAADAGAVRVLRFDGRTLAALGHRADPTAADWRPLPPPVGIDTPVPVDVPAGVALGPGETAVAANASAVLTVAHGTPSTWRVRATGKATTRIVSPLVPPGEWRAALAPDGSAVAIFSRATNGIWPGRVWSASDGTPIPVAGLSIDDGAGRETGAPRSLACLLPGGRGAIVTYSGAPADRSSAFQPLWPHATSEQTLRTPYVMTCLTTRAARR